MAHQWHNGHQWLLTFFPAGVETSKCSQISTLNGLLVLP